MKVLYLNCNYFTGIRGGWKSYILRGYRYFVHPSKYKHAYIKKLQEIIHESKADVVCLTEVRSQHLLHFKQGFPHMFDACKYEGTRWSKIPGLRKNRIAVLSKDFIHAEKQFFKTGMKRVFLTFRSIWGEGHFVHLSLGKRTRNNQISDLRKRIHDRAFFVGDFNTLSKTEQGVCPIYQNKVHNILSFPSIGTKRTLDHCIGTVCQDITYFDSEISDHLGMIFQIGAPRLA